MSAAIEPTQLAAILEQVAATARDAGVFGGVAVADGVLTCHADGSAESAAYRVRTEGDALWVELVMEDRWQSGSIESDLMNSGDSLEELLDEELADQGFDGEALDVEHFRSEDMLFTFRSRTPQGADADTLGRVLLAYEACFRKLGDMDAENSEDD